MNLIEGITSNGRKKILPEMRIKMELQIRKGGTANTEGFTVVTDKKTDGQDFYEEFHSLDHARYFVLCWNSHDALLKACKGLMSAWILNNKARSMHQLKQDMDTAYELAKQAIVEAEKRRLNK